MNCNNFSIFTNRKKHDDYHAYEQILRHLNRTDR